jgi:hypothetical protein
MFQLLSLCCYSNINYKNTIAQALVAGLSSQRLGFAPRSVHVRFVVDKVTLGRVFFRVLGFFRISIISQ